MKQFPITVALLLSSNLVHAAPAVKNSLENENFGLYHASAFRLSSGPCADCQTSAQASWYFPEETIASPRLGTSVAGLDKNQGAQPDVRSWAAAPKLNDHPQLIWVGSSKVIEAARMAPDGKTITLADGQPIDFAITPKIATNLAYYNASTQQYYQQRPVRMRGELVQENGREKFIARTIWPKDFSLAADAPLQPLAQGESLKTLVRANQGGATSPFESRVLWERRPGTTRNWAQLSAIGVMLNGAQGDDDEAHGGHFAIATGRYRSDGDWSNWLINNFYNLDTYSEKGIVAAATPMDKYLMDLNSGQSFYRPSYMVVALLKDDRPAQMYQGAINRVYNHLYRHDFSYNHSRNNCAGISVDTFQAMGWNIPLQGPSGYPKAIGAYAYVAASEQSLEKGRQIYDYLTEDKTRLYPAVAFDVMGQDLLNMAQGKSTRPLTSYEQSLADNIEALIFVRIPQIPSSRAMGLAPVFSFDEYMRQAPADHSQWKTVPTAARPFPNELREGLALNPKSPSPLPAPVLGTGLLGGVVLLSAVKGIRRRKCTTKLASGSINP